MTTPAPGIEVTDNGTIEVEGEQIKVYGVVTDTHTFTKMQMLEGLSNFGEPVTLGVYFQATEGTEIVNKITNEERNFLGRVTRPGDNQGEVDPAPSEG